MPLESRGPLGSHRASSACDDGSRRRCCSLLGSAHRTACHGRRARWPAQRRAARRPRGAAAAAAPARAPAAPPPGEVKDAGRRLAHPPPNRELAAPTSKPREAPGPLDALRRLLPPNSPVEITELPGKGRGLVAARRLEAGELVLREEPLAWELEEDERGNRCANCARLAGEGVLLRPCAGCSGAYVLCGGCKSHPCCGAVGFAVSGGHGVPSSCAMLAMRVAEIVLRRDEVSAAVDALAWHKVGFSSEMRVFDAYPKVLQDVVHGAHVRCSCNSFAMRTPDRSPFGRGLFLLCSMSNSDCDPNVSTGFKGESSLTAMTMQTVRAIEAGEEICGCYVEVYLPRSLRREQLRGTWGFDCQCARCHRALGPTGDERWLFGVRCTACGEVFSEFEGEHCHCGGDSPEMRGEAVKKGLALREEAIRRLGRRSSQARAALRRHLGGGGGAGAWEAPPGEALDMLQESLLLLKGALACLHKECLYTLNALGEAVRTFGNQEEYDVLRKEFLDLRAQRAACMHGERPEAGRPGADAGAGGAA